MGVTAIPDSDKDDTPVDAKKTGVVVVPDPEPAAPAVKPKTTAGQAFRRGAAQGAGFGLPDEAYGFGASRPAWQLALAANPFTAPIVPLLPAQATPRTVGRGVNAPLATDSPELARREARGEWRRDDAQARREHPVASVAGQVAGGMVATAPLAPASGVLKAGGQLAAEGALSGYGASESDTAGGQLADAGIGAGTTLAVGGALKGVGALVSSAAPRIARMARNRRLAQAGISEADAANFPGGPDELARRLRETRVVKGVRDRQGIVNQAEQFVQNADKTRAQVLENVREPIPGQQVAGAMREAGNEFGGMRDVLAARKVAQNAANEEVRAAEEAAEQIRAQNEALGLNRPFKRPSPDEKMRPPPTPAELADTGTGMVQPPVKPRGGTAQMRGVRPNAPTVEMATRPVTAPTIPNVPAPPVRPQPPATSAERSARAAYLMAGPKNARKGRSALAQAEARIAQAKARAANVKQLVPEPGTGRAERRVIERDAAAFENRPVPVRELNARRADYRGRAKIGAAGESPQTRAYGAMHRVAADQIEGAIERQEPGAGRLWRELGRDEGAVIKAREAAEKAMGQTDRGRVGLRQLGLGLAGGPKAILADLALSEGRGHGLAASALETMHDAPRGLIARMIRARAPQGVARVVADRVAEAAREHYVQSETNPEYARSRYVQ